MPVSRCFTCDAVISLPVQCNPPYDDLRPHYLSSSSQFPSSSSTSSFSDQIQWNQGLSQSQCQGDANTEKLSTLLRHFLPTASSITLRKYEQDLKLHKFPLCPDCDDYIIKIQDVEKEMDSLKFFIQSIIACLQFKVTSALESSRAQQNNNNVSTSENQNQPGIEPSNSNNTNETLTTLRENLLGLKEGQVQVQVPVALKDLRVALTRINLGGCTTVNAKDFEREHSSRTRIIKTSLKRTKPRIAGVGPESVKKAKVLRNKVQEDKKGNIKIENVFSMNNSTNNNNNNDVNECKKPQRDLNSTENQEPLNINHGEQESSSVRSSRRIRRKPLKFYSSDDETKVNLKHVPNANPKLEVIRPIDPGADNENDVDVSFDNDDNPTLDPDYDDNDTDTNDSDWVAPEDGLELQLELDSEEGGYRDDCPQKGDSLNNIKPTDNGCIGNMPSLLLNAPSVSAKVPSKPQPPRRGKVKTEKPVKEKKKRVPRRDPNKPLKRILTKPPRPAVKITEIQPRVFRFEEGGCQFVHVDEGNFQCSTCFKSFTTRTRVVVHIRYIHLGYNLGLLGEYLCNLCGKSFNREGSLKLHEQSMHGTKSHMCNICGRLFALAGNLKSHMLTHGDQRQFVCEMEGCDRKFLRKKELIYHTNKHHLNIRPHQCDQCGKTYTRHAELLLHQRSHSGQRPFQCQLCQSNFFLKARLTRHMKKVHKMFDFVPDPQEKFDDPLSCVPRRANIDPGNNENENHITINHVEFNDLQDCNDFVTSLINVHVHPAPSASPIAPPTHNING